MRPAAGLPDKLTSLGTKRTRTSCGLLHNGTMHGYGSLRELLPASQQHCFSVSVQFLAKLKSQKFSCVALNVSQESTMGRVKSRDIDESPGEFLKNPWVKAIRQETFKSDATTPTTCYVSFIRYANRSADL
jgi:hypothetical protein